MISYTTKYADSWNLGHISTLFEEVTYYFCYLKYLFVLEKLKETFRFSKKFQESMYL